MSHSLTHLLVVEDDSDDLFLFKSALAEGGGAFDVNAVETIQAAEVELARWAVDLILLDLSLPDATGLEALRHLRSLAPSVPIVVLSGLSDKSLALAAVRQGAQDFIDKSELTAQSLNKAISYALERQDLEQQLRQSQKMESIGRLAGGIAHDFNNLLTVIRANADLLTHHGELNASSQEWVNQISETTDRAVSLVRRLLVFSRNEPVSFSVLSVNEVVASVAQLLRRILGEQVTLNLDLSPALGWIKGDAGMLEQMIVNLAINARDAMPNGGELRIETRPTKFAGRSFGPAQDQAAGDYVRLRMNDTGHGIPAADLTHVFEPFFTTKEPGKGTGLGLSIVYGIVQEHRGWIEVRSKVNLGTTLDIYLPATNEPVVRPQTVSIVQVPPKRSARVLYVEDDSTIRGLYHQLLQEEGYTMHTAESGHKALAMVEPLLGQLDIVVSDIVMPGGMSGVQLAKTIQTKRPDLPVLLVTGYTSEHLQDLGPLVHVLAKPFSKDQLVQRIESILSSEVL